MIGDNHKGETLYLWETSSGEVWKGFGDKKVNSVYKEAYEGHPLVRLRQSWPSIQSVERTPFVDLHWQFDENTGYLIVVSAIDNLLKGAAGQAVQNMNLALGLNESLGVSQIPLSP